MDSQSAAKQCDFEIRATVRDRRYKNRASPPHDVDRQDAGLMPRQQVIDEIADDRVRLVSELRHDAANQRSAATVPLQIDRAVEITRAMDLGPAVRAAGLFR